MSDKHHIPQNMLAWPLFGAGMDKLGKNERPCSVRMPEISDDEMLVRIDAVGLCFSDIKLINSGEQHPRVISKNLEREPVIPGHEAVMTAVKIGKNLAHSFKEGERFIIQADIYVKGKGVAYGYAIDGGMAEYSKIDRRILNGDEGCYLLPISDSTSAGIAALIEPWTCVIASYMLEYRNSPLKNGAVLIAGETSDNNIYEPGKLVAAANPSKISILNFSAANLENFRRRFPAASFEILKNIPADELYDDIFLCGVKDRSKGEKIAKLAKKRGVINFIGNYPEENWSFDVGAIHYNQWFYQGTESNNLSEAYAKNIRNKIRKGGACWLVGGAGAMGQMHAQLAVESPEGPSRILLTDMDDERIKHVCANLEPSIKKRKVEFKTLNPKSFPSQQNFLGEIAKFAEPTGGFDDIIMLVPVVSVVDSAAPFLKEDGLMNIFAGIPAGKEGLLNIRGIAGKGIRFIGSSGSTTAHLKHTLKLVGERKLNPAGALAAVGGMNELKKGLEAVAKAGFPGKIVIFPHCKNLPLTPLNKISELSPAIAETLSEEGFYTMETEKKIFELYGNKP